MCAAALAPAASPGAAGPKQLRRTDFMAAAAANERATRRLVATLVVIGATLGYLLGWNAEILLSPASAQSRGPWFVSHWGLGVAVAMVAVGVAWSVVALRFGDRLVLGVTRADPVSADEETVLHNVVEEMAIAAGLPKPAVVIVETEALNAFTTGLSTRRATIGVTRGLLDRLERDELQAVIGHEMGHIVNLDMRYATVVGVLVGWVVLLSDAARGGGRVGLFARAGRARGGGRAALAPMLILLLFAALAPLFARLVQMAISRQREFLADATSVRLTRNPAALISALEKLAAAAAPFPGANRATQHLFIVNPFRRFSDRSSRLMATHPPLTRRIIRLRRMA